LLKLSKEPSREEVLTFLAHATSYGNLGLFIGAGFSKAVLNEASEDEIALSWGDLLKKAAKKMGVKYESVGKVGVSYPEIASAICKSYCKEKGLSFKASLRELKQEIAALTSWYPTDEQREKYSKYLDAFDPSWIITTNYDLVIETLLTGRSAPLGPNDPLSAPKGVVPVFHLHGVRTNPEEIIIAQEDYITLFRPSEYRQMKLALTIKESATLLLGYALGDVNVLTALDWSRNVFRGERKNYPHGVIQVLREEEPAEAPYRTRNGVVIIETDELSKLFEEFMEVRNRVAQEKDKERETLDKLAAKLSAPKSSMIEKFIDDEKFRSKTLKILSESSIHLVAGFVLFLDKCIEETYERSKPSGAFFGYDQALTIILDILTAFPIENFPPALFQKAAYGLERLGCYVGGAYGQSWAAEKTWISRAKELSPEIVKELGNVARLYSYGHLKELLTTIPD
jgi:hypothetical protein